ncbi:MAG: DUF302 domain-containing protein [Bacteroidota bacterium]|nr:DUF302 domain-containing protein [Bacteroidota bacterium]
MNTQINVSHERIALEGTYEAFIQNIEIVLNRLNPDWSSGLLGDPDSVKQHLTRVAGKTGLMIFGQQEHGKLLNIKGKPRKAIQYLIGNPLTAVEMTQYDIRAALYAPLRIIVYEGDDKVLYAEYDLPSTLFGQFGNADILKIAKGLDESILEVILLSDKKLK